VTFIDDHTHFAVVYLLKDKSEVFQRFQEYEAMATSHFNLNISRLRRDTGTEYTSNEFEVFCKMKGILNESTIPYTPEQNGVSERMNRTLVEKARTIIIESGLANRFWGDAISCACYLTNRSPCSVYKEKVTPFERWFGRKPDISKLRIFGCVAFALPKEKRRKLDKKSLKCRFIGYVPNGYKLWDLENKKVIVSRDVIFDESVMKVDSCKTYKVEEYHFESKENTDSGEDSHRQDTESGDGDENPVHEEHHSDDSDEEGDLNATLVPEVEQDVEPRRSERIRKTPIWQNDYQVAKLCEALLTDGEVDGIPQTIPELKRRDDWNLWEEAINVLAKRKKSH
jgi:hypothetical protein